MFKSELIKGAADTPGVYLMRDAAGQVLYVGKALSLRKRLQSYTRIDPAAGRSKTAVMLSKVAAVDTMLTRTEKEALILESGLIKQYRPRYNVILRDDKSYPHLKVTLQEEWPRLLMCRRPVKDGARYFGPYASPAAMWETLRLLNSLFPLRRCKSKKFKPGQRACLNFQMGRCPGACIGAISPAEYRERVDRVLAILEGRKRELTRDLERRMHVAAGELHFEEAAVLRDQVRALHQTLEKQVVLSPEGGDQDVFGFARRAGKVAVALLLVREGALVDKREFFLDEPVGEDGEVLAELLRRFYEPEARLIPRRILLPFIPDGQAALAEWLSEKRNGPVQLVVPQRGDKKALVAMAGDNAGQILVAREKASAELGRIGCCHRAPACS
jgi:excinuclease ABC subunit C